MKSSLASAREDALPGKSPDAKPSDYIVADPGAWASIERDHGAASH
ncbi:hypothetical protein [Roseateles sp.]